MSNSHLPAECRSGSARWLKAGSLLLQVASVAAIIVVLTAFVDSGLMRRARETREKREKESEKSLKGFWGGAAQAVSNSNALTRDLSTNGPAGESRGGVQ